MMTNATNSIAREKAKLLRSREYIESMDDDDVIEEAFLSLDRKLTNTSFNLMCNESAEETEERLALEKCIDDIPIDDSEEKEIDKILESTEDLTIDQIIGI